MLFRFFHDKIKSPPSTGSSRGFDEIRSHKEYSRFSYIPLPEVSVLEADLFATFKKRESNRTFNASDTLSKDDLARVLASGMREENRGRRWRPAPSGGGLYPLEAYVVIERVAGVPPGVYHYNPVTHGLEDLSPVASGKAFKDALTYPWSKDASAYVLLSSVWNRTMVKYGDFGYRLTLLEAGHVMQNMLLSLAALSLIGVPLLGFLPDETEEALGFREDDESALYLLALGTAIR